MRRACVKMPRPAASRPPFLNLAFICSPHWPPAPDAPTQFDRSSRCQGAATTGVVQGRLRTVGAPPAGSPTRSATSGCCPPGFAHRRPSCRSEIRQHAPTPSFVGGRFASVPPCARRRQLRQKICFLRCQCESAAPWGLGKPALPVIALMMVSVKSAMGRVPAGSRTSSLLYVVCFICFFFLLLLCVWLQNDVALACRKTIRHQRLLSGDTTRKKPEGP